METESGFDLDAAVNGWRRSLEQQRGLTSDRIRELVQHLEESMERLRERGLTAEESFWIAHRRLGSPEALAEEFIKADPTAVWRERLVWMILGLMLFQLWGVFLGPFLSLASFWIRDAGAWGRITFVLACQLFALAPLVPVLLMIRGRYTARLDVLDRLLHDRRRALVAFMSLAFGIWPLLALFHVLALRFTPTFPRGVYSVAGYGINCVTIAVYYGIVYLMLPARASKKAA